MICLRSKKLYKEPRSKGRLEKEEKQNSNAFNKKELLFSGNYKLIIQTKEGKISKRNK